MGGGCDLCEDLRLSRWRGRLRLIRIRIAVTVITGVFMDFKSDDTRIWLEDADGREVAFLEFAEEAPDEP